MWIAGKGAQHSGPWPHHCMCRCLRETSRLGAGVMARAGAVQPAHHFPPPPPWGQGQQGLHAELGQLWLAPSQGPHGSEVSGGQWPRKEASLLGDQAQGQGEWVMAGAGSTAPHPKLTVGLGTGPWVAARGQMGLGLGACHRAAQSQTPGPGPPLASCHPGILSVLGLDQPRPVGDMLLLK